MRRREIVPRVSLIVSTLGRTVELERLLVSLNKQAFRDFEVIVVDQNTDDRLAPVLERHSRALHLVAARSARGLSLGRNTGLALATGEIVAFPDDDCWYPERLLQDVIAMFEQHTAVDLFSGRTVDRDFAPSLGVFHQSGRSINRANVWRAGNSNTIFVRTGAKGQVYFDETLGVGAESSFQSGEETDLLLRLIRTKAALRFDPKLVVHHDQVDLLDAITGLSRARAYAPGQGRVLRLHQFHHVQLLWFACRPLARAALAALAGDVALARYKLAWSRGLLAGYLAPLPEPTAVSSAAAMRQS